MKIEEQLKSIILSQHKSIRSFSLEIDIPYSTIDSILKRGILNAGVGNIIRIFHSLNLDVESISTGCLSFCQESPPVSSDVSLSQLESELVLAYRRASDDDRIAVEAVLRKYREEKEETLPQSEEALNIG